MIKTIRIKGKIVKLTQCKIEVLVSFIKKKIQLV